MRSCPSSSSSASPSSPSSSSSPASSASPTSPPTSSPSSAPSAVTSSGAAMRAVRAETPRLAALICSRCTASTPQVAIMSASRPSRERTPRSTRRSAYLTACLGSIPTLMKDWERSRVAEVLLRRSARGSSASASHRVRCASSALSADATAAAETRLLSALSITAFVRLLHDRCACRTSGWRSKALHGARARTQTVALIFAAGLLDGEALF